MNTEWAFIEFLAIAVESAAMVFFLNSRFKSKTPSQWPQWITVTTLVTLNTICRLTGLPLLEVNLTVILLVYLIVAKNSAFLHKIFGVVLVHAILIATSLAGAGLAAAILDISFADTAYYQDGDSARLLALILVKTIQVIAFYALSKKHLSFRSLQKWPAGVLLGTVSVVFACLVLLILFVVTTELDSTQVFFATIIAGGLLLITVALFALFELFIRDEMRNLKLHTQVQRLELESHFYQEIDTMYSDMRIWRHDYKNNLTALLGLLEEKDISKAVKFIEHIVDEPMRGKKILQTGNLVLDAIVSSKLLLAQSKDIDVTVQVTYPEVVPIEDNDLCAIAGNLMDNAIEACEQIEKLSARRFIDFSILAKGKNIILTIRNSTNGVVRKDGDDFLTTKTGAYHGQGLKYVDSIVEKYRGYVHREHNNSCFETYVLLPLTKGEGK